MRLRRAEGQVEHRGSALGRLRARTARGHGDLDTQKRRRRRAAPATTARAGGALFAPASAASLASRPGGRAARIFRHSSSEQRRGSDFARVGPNDVIPRRFVAEARGVNADRPGVGVTPRPLRHGDGLLRFRRLQEERGRAAAWPVDPQRLTVGEDAIVRGRPGEVVRPARARGRGTPRWRAAASPSRGRAGPCRQRQPLADFLFDEQRVAVAQHATGVPPCRASVATFHQCLNRAWPSVPFGSRRNSSSRMVGERARLGCTAEPASPATATSSAGNHPLPRGKARHTPPPSPAARPRRVRCRRARRSRAAP